MTAKMLYAALVAISLICIKWQDWERGREGYLLFALKKGKLRTISRRKCEEELKPLQAKRDRLTLIGVFVAYVLVLALI